jgi:hypothetical protein
MISQTLRGRDSLRKVRRCCFPDRSSFCGDRMLVLLLHRSRHRTVDNYRVRYQGSIFFSGTDIVHQDRAYRIGQRKLNRVFGNGNRLCSEHLKSCENEGQSFLAESHICLNNLKLNSEEEVAKAGGLHGLQSPFYLFRTSEVGRREAEVCSCTDSVM